MVGLELQYSLKRQDLSPVCDVCFMLCAKSQHQNHKNIEGTFLSIAALLLHYYYDVLRLFLCR